MQTFIFFPFRFVFSFFPCFFLLFFSNSSSVHQDCIFENHTGYILLEKNTLIIFVDLRQFHLINLSVLVYLPLPSRMTNRHRPQKQSLNLGTLLQQGRPSQQNQQDIRTPETSYSRASLHPARDSRVQLPILPNGYDTSTILFPVWIRCELLLQDDVHSRKLWWINPR